MSLASCINSLSDGLSCMGKYVAPSTKHILLETLPIVAINIGGFTTGLLGSSTICLIMSEEKDIPQLKVSMIFSATTALTSALGLSAIKAGCMTVFPLLGAQAVYSSLTATTSLNRDGEAFGTILGMASIYFLNGAAHTALEDKVNGVAIDLLTNAASYGIAYLGTKLWTTT